jgi:hypothetical protein
MHALLGPAVVGRQIPLVHVMYDVIPLKKNILLLIKAIDFGQMHRIN